MSIAKTYVVNSRIQETRGIVTLALTDREGEVPQFVPGQYITVYVPERGTQNGRSYSISSAPGESTFSITIRAMGECSNYLCTLQPGATIEATLPYGFFYPDDETNDLTLIAAGMGITPFRSMLRMIMVQNPTRRIRLFRSVCTMRDALFEDELNAYGAMLPNLLVCTFVTRENITEHSSMLGRRMEVADVLRDVNCINETEFLISGSLSFTYGMYSSLVREGVPSTMLHTEAFFSL